MIHYLHYAFGSAIHFNHVHFIIDNFLPSAYVIRYYRNIPDRDIHEALSEEDLYTAQALKNSPRKSSAGYHQNWIPQRNSNRYDTMISPMQSSRRDQTRPEIKSFTEAEIVDRRKCSRCGNVSIRKPSISKKNNCRFQDNPNFSTRRHFGKRDLQSGNIENS